MFKGDIIILGILFICIICTFVSFICPDQSLIYNISKEVARFADGL